jgi:hypothetical protein
MKKGVLTLVFVIALGITSMFAPPPADPPGGNGGGGPIGGPTGVPIDGGLGFLAAAGIAYAGKKLFDKKNKDSNNQNSEL